MRKLKKKFHTASEFHPIYFNVSRRRNIVDIFCNLPRKERVFIFQYKVCLKTDNLKVYFMASELMLRSQDFKKLPGQEKHMQANVIKIQWIIGISAIFSIWRMR